MNWQASSQNLAASAPSAGELQQQVGDYLKSGNIMGKKTDDMGDCHAHAAGAMEAVDFTVSAQKLEEMCSGR